VHSSAFLCTFAIAGGDKHVGIDTRGAANQAAQRTISSWNATGIQFLEKTANVNSRSGARIVEYGCKRNRLVASPGDLDEEFRIFQVQEIFHFGAHQIPSSQESRKLDRVDNGERLGTLVKSAALFFGQKLRLDVLGKIQGTIYIRQDIKCPT
jgi:hypothetical protein